ncbi:MAG: DUF1697 domain-containing protein [Boseongicola sp.]|nr:DUF1697 domain-containing protein [Boseongicola sp.]MDE0344357.1 DUF1697 domain-containing protein [Boseongicola sp.]MXW86581.1 DUF1697 domain-containing protein [Boseongicola sp. SB0667_bin_21]MYI69942.1 DUF1697 domain-containing protein [Boseongicola sp. SB0673_bin_14]
MTPRVLLLRGINVGGRGKLPMAELRAAIEAAGGSDPKTYIQTGNAVFRGSVGEVALSDEIEARAGFRPGVMLLDAHAFAAIRQGNPFPDATDDAKALHVGFLAAPPACTQADLDAARGAEERALLTSAAVYLHTPKHLSGSALAPRLERLVGVPLTLRNWRTVEAIAALLDEAS